MWPLSLSRAGFVAAAPTGNVGTTACQPGLPIGYLGQGTLQAAEAVSTGLYGRDTVLSTGPSSLIAEPLFSNENFTGDLPTSSLGPHIPTADDTRSHDGARCRAQQLAGLAFL